MDINDKKNIVGVSYLMGSNDTDKYDILALEKEIISGADFNVDETENDAEDYERELSRLTNVFGLENKKESQSEPEQSYDYDPPKNNYYEPEDKQLRSMTLEQQRTNYVSEALNDIDDENNDLEIDIDQEKEDDDKNELISQIEQLRDTLDDDGVRLENVPKVSKENSFSDIKNIYKILRLKNDRNRYCSFAEELILAGAQGIEYMFDGKNDYFGRRPDLSGWSNTVKIKLRRCRFQTSSLVKDMMQDYNMGPGMQLFLELVPSLFLYSRQKKLADTDNISNDASYNDAISNLNNQNY
jgi:hypothetical protein